MKIIIIMFGIVFLLLSFVNQFSVFNPENIIEVTNHSSAIVRDTILGTSCFIVYFVLEARDKIIEKINKP